jgi:hypothetical protein
MGVTGAAASVPLLALAYLLCRAGLRRERTLRGYRRRFAEYPVLFLRPFRLDRYKVARPFFVLQAIPHFFYGLGELVQMLPPLTFEEAVNA